MNNDCKQWSEKKQSHYRHHARLTGQSTLLCMSFKTKVQFPVTSDYDHTLQWCEFSVKISLCIFRRQIYVHKHILPSIIPYVLELATRFSYMKISNKENLFLVTENMATPSTDIFDNFEAIIHIMVFIIVFICTTQVRKSYLSEPTLSCK